MLKTVYGIIAELHADGQEINLEVIRNVVMGSRISDKGTDTGVWYTWAGEDGMIKM